MKDTLEKAKIPLIVIVAIGALVKIMHWPGANILLIIGLSSLAILSVMQGFIKPSESKIEIMINYAYNFGIAITLLGALFKTMRWAGANVMLIEGFGSIAMVHFVRATIKPEGGFKYVIINLTKNLGIAFTLMGVLFKLMHWPGADMILTMGIISSVIGYGIRLFEAK